MCKLKGHKGVAVMFHVSSSQCMACFGAISFFQMYFTQRGRWQVAWNHFDKKKFDQKILFRLAYHTPVDRLECFVHANLLIRHCQ